MTMTTMYITCCAAVVFGLEGAYINAQYISSQILIRILTILCDMYGLRSGL